MGTQANAKSSATPSADNLPRPPDTGELRQLADWLANQAYEPDDAVGTAKDAYVAVFDHYISGGPGYVGKVMVVVWDGAPSFFDCFVWEGGRMARSGRDYDDRECYRCGAKNGALCFSCWNTEQPGPGHTPAAKIRAHTPAPWTVVNPFGFGSNLAVNAKSKGIVCRIENRFTGAHSEVDPEESEANARLMAAAPSLAEALETLLDVFLDGRTGELSEKEERANAKASAALDDAYGVPRTASSAHTQAANNLTLRGAWCECERGLDDPIFMPDNCCGCGEDKHHYHCHVCKGISQVG